ncbi:MAG: hypothetical protein JXA57_17075 [Armatimonadetes bacterium]|nr:hypothetical protein [Armatimonadota bacterium]
MDRTPLFVVSVICVVFLLGAGCATPTQDELAAFPIESAEGVLAGDLVVFDEEVSADGNGSFRIEAADTVTVALYEAGDVDAESTCLSYSARLRTEELDGSAYLEMWCVFAGEGEYFSRGVDSALSGTNDWTEVSIPFMLKAGENPTNVKLNVVVEGTGTVWIDDLRLAASASR